MVSAGSPVSTAVSTDRSAASALASARSISRSACRRASACREASGSKSPPSLIPASSGVTIFTTVIRQSKTARACANASSASGEPSSGTRTCAGSIPGVGWRRTNTPSGIEREHERFPDSTPAFGRDRPTDSGQSIQLVRRRRRGGGDDLHLRDAAVLRDLSGPLQRDLRRLAGRAVDRLFGDAVHVLHRL